MINFFKKISQEFARRQAIRMTIKELSKLSNKELNDIGLCRGDIYTMAHASFPKKDDISAPVNRNMQGWV